MPKYCNKYVITQDIHMPCSMATTSFGKTVGTRPTFSDSEKPKPFLLQLIPSLPIWGLGVQCHCRRLANSGETHMEQTILEYSLKIVSVEGDVFCCCLFPQVSRVLAFPSLAPAYTASLSTAHFRLSPLAVLSVFNPEEQLQLNAVNK